MDFTVIGICSLNNGSFLIKQRLDKHNKIKDKLFINFDVFSSI